MQLDLEFGFRSSFNFVPEGDYSVPRQLREELTQNGFEVGIHDLRHDGRLYQSHREFCQRAIRINRYLGQWAAAGFRSAFMLHKLDWLHELDIRYDASTFDTDPFEPQPEGRHTIFPFWVPAPGNQRSDDRGQMTEDRRQRSDDRPCHLPLATCHSAAQRSGYVELPYTLPQDFTLFVLLRENTAGIWQRKLDWIAEHGGMALFITHPDYMAFSDKRSNTAGEYPFELYKQFLEYVRSRYSGQYWQALPREVAAHVIESQNGFGRAVSVSESRSLLAKET